MNRRKFMATGATAALVGAAGARAQSQAIQKGSFRLRYAPHFGMFENRAGEVLGDQIKFAADVGFAAWEDRWFLTELTQDKGVVGRPDIVQTSSLDIGPQCGRIGLQNLGILLISSNVGLTARGMGLAWRMLLCRDQVIRTRPF